jgi:hypothetical protein
VLVPQHSKADLDAMKKKELLVLAKAAGLNLTSKAKPAELVASLSAHYEQVAEGHRETEEVRLMTLEDGDVGAVGDDGPKEPEESSYEVHRIVYTPDEDAFVSTIARLIAAPSCKFTSFSVDGVRGDIYLSFGNATATAVQAAVEGGVALFGTSAAATDTAQAAVRGEVAHISKLAYQNKEGWEKGRNASSGDGGGGGSRNPEEAPRSEGGGEGSDSSGDGGGADGSGINLHVEIDIEAPPLPFEPSFRVPLEELDLPEVSVEPPPFVEVFDEEAAPTKTETVDTAVATGHVSGTDPAIAAGEGPPTSKNEGTDGKEGGSEGSASAAPHTPKKTKAPVGVSFVDLSTLVQNESEGDGSPEVEHSEKIDVYVRCRPLMPKEVANGVKSCVRCNVSRQNEVKIHGEQPWQKNRNFKFAKVFGSDSTQEKLYQECVEPIVRQTVEGYNCTVFAYGQTGTGKTYSMEGTLDKSDTSGIIPRSLHTIFELLQNDAESYTVNVSHMEIYKEQIIDLLGNEIDELSEEYQRRASTSREPPPAEDHGDGHDTSRMRRVQRRHRTQSDAMPTGTERSRKRMELQRDLDSGDNYSRALAHIIADKDRRLKIMQDQVRGIVVQGLKEIQVDNVESVCKVLARSVRNRHTAETLCNVKSSRSHAIFSVMVHSNMGGSVTKIGRLNLVDLSGSENAEKAGFVKERQAEAASISQGLLSLGRVIRCLVERRKHIPYRESNLTRLLAESLGGNTKVIARLSPLSLSDIIVVISGIIVIVSDIIDIISDIISLSLGIIISLTSLFLRHHHHHHPCHHHHHP